MKPSEVLRAAKAKISTPETWCKHEFSIGERRCASQALNATDYRAGICSAPYGFLLRAAQMLTPNAPDVVCVWNDAFGSEDPYHRGYDDGFCKQRGGVMVEGKCSKVEVLP